MQLPPLPDTSVRHRSMVGNPQLAAPWFVIAHQRCAAAFSGTMIVTAADRMRAVKCGAHDLPRVAMVSLQYLMGTVC